MSSRRVDNGIIQRGKSYTFTVALGMDIHGKQIRKTTTYKAPEELTEKQADKLAKEHYIEFKNRCKGLQTINENLRFKDICEEYFKVYAPNKLKEVSAARFRSAVDNHLIELLGNRKLKDINTAALTSVFNNLTNVRSDAELSASTIASIYGALRSIYKFAISQGYIKENPCTNVILPKTRCTSGKRKYLLESELEEFMKLFEEYSSLNVIINFLLHTGVRIGEALALKWSDIDFNNKTVRIKHTLSYINNELVLSTPKSDKSQRTIVLNDTILKMLNIHRLAQRKDMLMRGSFMHLDMIFTSSQGNYMHSSSVERAFKKVLKNTRFDFMTLHSLRKTNATLLLNNETDIKIVSEHLGHSNIGITASAYASVLASTRTKTASTIEKALAVGK